MIDARHLIFARRVLLHFAETGFITWRRYNHLIRSVDQHESRILGCEGKHRFDTFDLAHKVATKPTRDGGKMRAYACRVCAGWHITGLSLNEARARRLRIEELRDMELRDAQL